VRANIAAAIGPAIAQENYEVGQDFIDRFDEGWQRFFIPGAAGKWHFDLPGFVGWRLAAMQLGTVEVLGIDTYANDARFHSYRRATHRGEPAYGRQYSLIGIR